MWIYREKVLIWPHALVRPASSRAHTFSGEKKTTHTYTHKEWLTTTYGKRQDLNSVIYTPFGPLMFYIFLICTFNFFLLYPYLLLMILRFINKTSFHFLLSSSPHFETQKCMNNHALSETQTVRDRQTERWWILLGSDLEKVSLSSRFLWRHKEESGQKCSSFSKKEKHLSSKCGSECFLTHRLFMYSFGHDSAHYHHALSTLSLWNSALSCENTKKYQEYLIYHSISHITEAFALPVFII